jgi:hypothetical protein
MDRDIGWMMVGQINALRMSAERIAEVISAHNKLAGQEIAEIEYDCNRAEGVIREDYGLNANNSRSRKR